MNPRWAPFSLYQVPLVTVRVLLFTRINRSENGRSGAARARARAFQSAWKSSRHDRVSVNPAIDTGTTWACRRWACRWNRRGDFIVRLLARARTKSRFRGKSTFRAYLAGETERLRDSYNNRNNFYDLAPHESLASQFSPNSIRWCFASLNKRTSNLLRELN